MAIARHRANVAGAHAAFSDDHLLVRGSWKVSADSPSDGGSDHRALVADVRLA